MADPKKIVNRLRTTVTSWGGGDDMSDWQCSEGDRDGYEDVWGQSPFTFFGEEQSAWRPPMVAPQPEIGMSRIPEEFPDYSTHVGAWPAAQTAHVAPRPAGAAGLPFVDHADFASSWLDIAQGAGFSPPEGPGLLGGASGALGMYSGLNDMENGADRGRRFSDQAGSADDDLVAGELQRARLEQVLGASKLFGGFADVLDSSGVFEGTNLAAPLGIAGPVMGLAEGVTETALGVQTLRHGGTGADEEEAMRQIPSGLAGIAGVALGPFGQMLGGSYTAGAAVGEHMYEDANEKFRGASDADAPIGYDIADYCAEAGWLAKQDYLEGIEDPSARQLRVAERKGRRTAMGCGVIDTLDAWWY
jgi:hypothetical protein